MENLSNFHPIAVHFPIALLYTYIIVEVIGLFKQNSTIQYGSLFLLGAGIMGGIASVISGNLEYQSLQLMPEISKLHIYHIDKHSDMATLTMWYFLGILIFKLFIFIKKKHKSPLHIVFIIFTILGGYLIFITGELGGILVYKYGIGTELIN